MEAVITSPGERAAELNKAVPSEPVSFEQFLEWAEEDTFVEWVNGKIVNPSPVSWLHQDVAGFLAALLRHFVEARQLGKVLQDPFQMKTGPELPSRAPDVLFLAKENIGRLKTNYLDGPADLVVEVISPESAGRDRGDKFYEYEQGGVREYWLVDPVRRQAEFYERGLEGLFTPATVDSGGKYHSRVLKGLWIKPEWLWQNPLPTLAQVIKELGIAFEG